MCVRCRIITRRDKLDNYENSNYKIKYKNINLHFCKYNLTNSRNNDAIHKKKKEFSTFSNRDSMFVKNLSFLELF